MSWGNTLPHLAGGDRSESRRRRAQHRLADVAPVRGRVGARACLGESVTNVAAFGAFVGIGVHRDGLVHVSELAQRFVKDPSEVVKVGDRVKVLQVDEVQVDEARRRIGLSMKALDAKAPQASAPQGRFNAPRFSPRR